MFCPCAAASDEDLFSVVSDPSKAPGVKLVVPHRESTETFTKEK
jgi:hypothetical protein